MLRICLATSCLSAVFAVGLCAHANLWVIYATEEAHCPSHVSHYGLADGVIGDTKPSVVFRSDMDGTSTAKTFLL